jgi:hypothetical protein
MKSKLVTLVAILAFSGSVFANKGKEQSEATKAKVAELSKISNEKEANKRVTEELLANVAKTAGAKEKAQAGLDLVFEPSEIVQKVQFGARVKTMSESTDPNVRSVGMHLGSMLERVSTVSDKSVQESMIRLLKNSDITDSSQAKLYDDQVSAVSVLTYKKYVKGDASVKAEEIELIGIANIMKAELGLTGKGTAKRDIIFSLKDLSNEQLAKVKEKRDEWKKNCRPQA